MASSNAPCPNSMQAWQQTSLCSYSIDTLLAHNHTKHDAKSAHICTPAAVAFALQVHATRVQLLHASCTAVATKPDMGWGFQAHNNSSMQMHTVNGWAISASPCMLSQKALYLRSLPPRSSVMTAVIGYYIVQLGSYLGSCSGLPLLSLSPGHQGGDDIIQDLHAAKDLSVMVWVQHGMAVVIIKVCLRPWTEPESQLHLYITAELRQQCGARNTSEFSVYKRPYTRGLNGF